MKSNKIPFRAKKAFSLMEILIATVLLSVVLLSLFQVKSNNIFLVEKTEETKKQNDYINLFMDTTISSKRNENVYLDNYLSVNDDEIRRDFKEVKIKIKDEVLDKSILEVDKYSLSIENFKTTYSFENGIKKDIYRFKLELN